LKDHKSKQGSQPALKETPISPQEKKALIQNIKHLKPEQLKGVWEIVSQGVTSAKDNSLEIDIDCLPIRVAHQLESYVKEIISKMRRQRSSQNRKRNRSKVL